MIKKLQIRESQTGKSKLVDATQLGIVDKLSLDDKDYPYVLTDNGAYDLTKQGKNVIYTWVGKQHKGLRSLTSKQIGKLYDFIDKYVLPEFAKYCKTEKTSIHIDDFTNSTDMYRLWFEVSPTKSESTQVKNFRKSLIEKPVATSTKTTGYTERAIAIPKYEYSDIWEDGLEELLYDCKDVDDRVEWDIDYHGGMFGDTETLYLYSNGDTYEEIKYFIQQWRDKAMYESMKRRTTKTVKEDSFDEVGFDYKIRYISNFQQDALYDLVDYLVSLGAISGPEDKRIDIIEEPQLDSVQIKLLSDFKTYKKALDWIKHNDAYFYESKMTRRLGKKLHEQDVEIEVKNEGILEVPKGKNVEDLPMSHFEKLVKKNGLGKVNKALNNLQVWNKNKDKKLSKWAGDMIDKLNKKFEKSEGVYRKRRTVSKSSRINESFSEIEIMNLIKQRYGQSGVDAFYKAEELYNKYPDTFNTELIVLPAEPSVCNSARMTRRSKSGKTVDACFSEIMNGNIECLPKLIQVFYDLADLPQFRKFLRDNV